MIDFLLYDTSAGVIMNCDASKSRLSLFLSLVHVTSTLEHTIQGR